MKIIHRANMRGAPQCGAEGNVYISSSGVRALITCTDCQALEADYLPRCTVHAAPDCQQPDGPTYSGIGWDHAGVDLRIECAACAAYLST